MMKLPSVLIPVVVSLTCVAPAAGQEFRFNPPDGTTYVETVRVTQQTKTDRLGEMSESQESSSRVRVSRTAEGYSFAATILSGTVTQDGKELEIPGLLMPVGMTFTLETDHRGKLRQVRGYEELSSKLSQSLPADTAASDADVMSEDEMVEQERVDWRDRISGLIGRKCKVGEAWITAERIQLPTGRAVTHTMVTRVVGREKRLGHDCVRVKFAYNTNAAALRAFAGKALAGRLKGARRKAGAADVHVSGSGERLIDPTTMLIYGESTTRTVRTLVDVLGEEKVPTTVIVKRQYRYQYE
jgi:hypothetical protein